MPTSKKKWNVSPARGESVVVEAETMQLDETHSRVTFKNGEEVVATFVGTNSVYPVTG